MAMATETTTGRHREPGTRGSHKVFLGMAPGVGKTYAMLEEGHELQRDGVDVAIGVLETHGRVETARRAEGLEQIPRRAVTYRGVELEEMDLPGVLRRAPAVCLIDELAHTNAPGVEHAKRYADVADVLAAGIDVVSTMNVQHLESLNDLVAELAGVRVRETVPDRVLAHADEVVLVDITPGELLARLREGRVYPAERIDTALNNFFTIENLVALREVALRQVAESVGAQRIAYAGAVGTREESLPAIQAVGDRLLALVEPNPQAQRLVRRAWRSAARLSADLDVLWVRSSRDMSQEDERGLAALRQLASLLGAELHVIDSDDIEHAVVEFVAERGSTYVLLGRPRPATGLRRLRQSLPVRLMRRLDGVDLRIVADRAQRPEREW
ncbi:MAG TPA: histidine kinase [Solirubrobacteraceae bacterium]|nr:histidine kinase [Solirubrobacteraceae bacterium]